MEKLYYTVDWLSIISQANCSYQTYLGNAAIYVIFWFSINHMVSIYSIFLFCLLLWPGQETTTLYSAKSIFLLDFVMDYMHSFFNNHKSDAGLVQHTKMEIL